VGKTKYTTSRPNKVHKSFIEGLKARFMRSTGKAPEAYYFLPIKKENRKLRIEIKRITNIALIMLKKGNKADLYLLGVCLNTLFKLTEIKYKQLENL
jgi:hypothetical protein